MENFQKNQQTHNFNMELLRKHEGIHAPLKLAMEIQSVKQVGRLPFLTSSNALLDSLSGNDEIIDFSDFLGTNEFDETQRNPHAVMEKHLKIKDLK